MQRPWETDQRNNRHVAKTSKGFERSTSAPPPETSLLFGPRNDRDGNVIFDVSLVFFLYNLPHSDLLSKYLLKIICNMILEHLSDQFLPCKHFVLVGIEF